MVSHMESKQTNTQLTTTKKTEHTPNRKREQICGDQRQDMGEGEMEQSSQKAQTSSYKINSCQGYDL